MKANGLGTTSQDSVRSVAESHTKEPGTSPQHGFPETSIALTDIAALADTLTRVGVLADSYRDRLRGLDLNPLLVLDEGRGLVAVDWFVELRAP